MTDKFQNRYRIPSARAEWWDYGHPGAYFITICTRYRKQYFGEIRNGVMIPSEAGKIAQSVWHEIPEHSSGIDLGSFVVMPNHVHGVIFIQPGNDAGRDAATNTAVPDIIPQNSTFTEIDYNPADHATTDRIHDIGVNIDDIRPDRAAGGFGRDKACLVSTNPPDPCNPPTISDIDTVPGSSIFKTDEATIHRPIPGLSSPRSESAPARNHSYSAQRYRNQGKNTVSSVIGSYKSAVSKYVRRSGSEFAWQPRFWDNIIRDEAALYRICVYIENNVKNWKADTFFLR